ncbi:MAG: response regulator [Candidatus Hydrogenedentes bacterium]|nr:response regulator [Candidatus Hydrogenedentota bacterium]
MIEGKILFVDDDVNILEAHKRQFRKFFHVELALGPEVGLRLLEAQGPFAVVVADLRMPGMDGIEFLTRVRKAAPDTVRIMLTGYSDLDAAVHAVNEGNIFRFLAKPCPAEILAKALIAGIEQYRLITAEKVLLEKTLNGSIQLLTDILSMVNPEIFGWATRLRDSTRLVARQLRLPDTWAFELASLFSYIGYVTLPPELVTKARTEPRLTGAETEMIARVPEIGQQLLAHIPRLEEVAQIVLYQKKQYDGTGYPRDHVAGEQIPLGARILKVLTDLDDLASGGLARKDALAQMRQRKGWYDPTVIEAAAAVFAPFALTEPTEVPIALDVKVVELRLDDVLTSNAETSDHRLLIAAGTRLSEALLERLRNYERLIGVDEPLSIERMAPAQEAARMKG